MALSNYILQVVVLSILFQQHTVGLHLSLLAAPLCGVALFIAQALLSRWWLSRYRYGPLEWVWWAERLYNVRRLTPMPSGGHFAPAEEPELLARDIAALFAGL